MCCQYIKSHLRPFATRHGLYPSSWLGPSDRDMTKRIRSRCCRRPGAGPVIGGPQTPTWATNNSMRNFNDYVGLSEPRLATWNRGSATVGCYSAPPLTLNNVVRPIPMI